jgi:integrase
MTNVRVDRKTVLSQKEIDNMLTKADKLENKYFALRAKAIVSLGRTGKRRAEVANLEISDLKVEENFFYITFTVVKKRKKNVLAIRRTKRFPLESKYAQYIMEYWNHMKKEHPDCKFLFPSTHNIFGLSVGFSKDKHLSGRHLLRIVKQLNPKAWFHLFRETRGADVVRADERRHGQAGLETIFRVKRALDLEREATAWRYVTRYATETSEAEDMSD